MEDEAEVEFKLAVRTLQDVARNHGIMFMIVASYLDGRFQSIANVERDLGNKMLRHALENPGVQQKPIGKS